MSVSIGWDNTETRRDSHVSMILISLTFHVVVFLIVPIITKLFRQPTRFERPQTFQLVQPPIPQPVTRPKQQPVEKPKPQVKPPPPKPEPKKVETRAPSKPVPAKEPVQEEENLDELASLLEEIPAPAQVATPSNFKYHWYLNSVQQKAERHWQPPTRDPDISVVVAFTIYANGSISNPRVRTSSGSGMLDNLAIRAIRLAAPFGKLPPGFSENRLDLTCTFRPVRR